MAKEIFLQKAIRMIFTNTFLPAANSSQGTHSGMRNRTTYCKRSFRRLLFGSGELNQIRVRKTLILRAIRQLASHQFVISTILIANGSLRILYSNSRSISDKKLQYYQKLGFDILMLTETNRPVPSSKIFFSMNSQIKGVGRGGCSIAAPLDGF